jgi:hypothetical protein
VYRFSERKGFLFGVRRLSFEAWCNKDIIFFEGPLTLTRRQLVFTLRNQEGGSHYDEEVRNPNFALLQRKVAMSVMGRGMAKAENLELASMRQVAEELEPFFAIHAKGQHPNIRFCKLDEFEEKIKKGEPLI